MEDRPLSTLRDVAPGASHDRPAAVGMTIKTKIERGDRYSAPEVYTLEITLCDAIRGEEAKGRIINEQIAGLPDPGLEYVLIRVRLGYFSKGRGFRRENEPYVAEPDYFLALASGEMAEYSLPNLAKQPEPSIVGVPVAVGETREGWICLLVAEKDEHPFIVFKREFRENLYGLWGPVWFRL
jgi:hypothetical protein